MAANNGNQKYLIVTAIPVAALLLLSLIPGANLILFSLHEGVGWLLLYLCGPSVLIRLGYALFLGKRRGFKKHIIGIYFLGYVILSFAIGSFSTRCLARALGTSFSQNEVGMALNEPWVWALAKVL